MKRMTKAELDALGAKVKRKPKAEPKPQPKVDNSRLESELRVVQKELERIAKTSNAPQKKRRFEFSVERDGNGFIQKIHAKEM